MKSLKKLAAVAALLSAMNFAKASEPKEVQYGPTDYDEGKIDGIELVNGHLLVRSNGKFNGFEMPYGYTSTNTQNFAQSAFAQGGATNVNQYVHAGNGKVYMTFNERDGEVYTTQISSKEGPGCVPADVKDADTGVITEYAIKKVENPDQDPIAKAILNAQNGNGNTVFKVFGEGADAKLYYANSNGVYRCDSDKSKTVAALGLPGKTIEDFVVVDTSNPDVKWGYILASDADGRKVYNNTQNGIPGTTGIAADAIALTEDKQGVYIYSGDKVQVAKGGIISDPASSTLPAGTKSIVMSKDGKTMYYATAKKLGYKTLD